jgi:hypothetical protein
MKPMRQGQCLRHDVFGIGIAATSNDERTTIDFYEHGRKTFVTGLLVAELLADAPPKPPKPRGTGARKSGGEGR